MVSEQVLVDAVRVQIIEVDAGRLEHVAHVVHDVVLPILVLFVPEVELEVKLPSVFRERHFALLVGQADAQLDEFELLDVLNELGILVVLVVLLWEIVAHARKLGVLGLDLKVRGQ